MQLETPVYCARGEHNGNESEQNSLVLLPKRGGCLLLLCAYCVKPFFWMFSSLQHASSQ